MILSAGKTYEFSARLKCSGTTPQLRIALPQAAMHEAFGESMPDASGWKRVHNRVTAGRRVQTEIFRRLAAGAGHGVGATT